MNSKGRSTIANDTPNRRLSFHDAVFLHWERHNQPMHVGECMVYEGHFSRDELVELLAARLHLLPRYRQRVVSAPLRLSYPTWEDDPDFDLGRHVEEVTMPAPGDDRVLSTFVGQLFSERLDRDHPLWRVSVIQGHESGNTVLLMRLHHSMVDGVSAVALVDVLHSVDPEGEGAPAPPVPWEPKPLPGTLRLLQDALADRAGATAATLADAAGLLRPSTAARQARELGLLARTWVRALPTGLVPAPKTPWNHEISADRQLAWLELPFDEARGVRRTLGGTVNDLILAILAGGLGRYLRRHGYETQGMKLRTMVPVSMRRPGDEGPMGNVVSLVVVPLYVGVDDPVERLSLQREAMDQAKADDQAAGIYQMIQMGRRVPPPLHELQWRLSPTSTRWPINIVSTNVPGPQQPLYLAGREDAALVSARSAMDHAWPVPLHAQLRQAPGHGAGVGPEPGAGRVGRGRGLEGQLPGAAGGRGGPWPRPPSPAHAARRRPGASAGAAPAATARWRRRRKRPEADRRGMTSQYSQPLDQTLFRDVIGRFASGVTVITTRAEGRDFGTTASAVSSLSMDPPMLLVCLNTESETQRAIHASMRFAVNILGEDQAEVAFRFAKKAGSKFVEGDIVRAPIGRPHARPGDRAARMHVSARRWARRRTRSFLPRSSTPRGRKEAR